MRLSVGDMYTCFEGELGSMTDVRWTEESGGERREVNNGL